MSEYYANTAYHPEVLPEQPVPKKRSWLQRFSTARLPWGQTQQFYPVHTLQLKTPFSLRAREKAEQESVACPRRKQTFEQHDYHGIVNHERIRYASLSKKTMLWLYLWGGGRFVFWVMLVLSPPGWLLLADVSPDGFFKGLVSVVVETAPLFLGVP